jgi:hypothetical protein
MTGILPVQMAYLYNLEIMRAGNTSLSCSGVIRPYNITTNASCSDPDQCTTPQLVGAPQQESSDAAERCGDASVLPCFLRFSDYTLPREDNSNMRCSYIMRKTPEAARVDCAEFGLGGDAAHLPDLIKDSTQQQWLRDPS